MPNTLGHLGIQGLVTRAVFRRADLKWIGLGCVIPDVPWILQRALHPILPSSLHLDLRLYAVTLASLPLCLLLAATASLIAADSWRILRLLALNVVLHLLLDAGQAHWDNGAHVAAPFSWSSVSLGLFWPESPASFGLTLLGVVFLLLALFRLPANPVALTFAPKARAVAAGGLLAIYLILPLALMPSVESADTGSLRLLRSPEERPGRDVELNHVPFSRDDEAAALRVFTGERFVVTGAIPEQPAHISLRGRFLDAHTIEIVEYHEHHPSLRDLFSYVGLGALALVWLVDLYRQRMRAARGQPG